MSTDLTVAIVFSAASGVVVAISTLLAGLVVEATRAGDDVVGDVQRFIELSAAAHSSLPAGSVMSDPNGQTSAAISQLLAKKERAHHALWNSRNEGNVTHLA